MTTSPEPWERQPNERSVHYDVFITYRDLGPNRTLAQAAKVHPKNLNQVYKWSSKFKWTARAEAWDDHMDEVRRQEAEDEVRKMSERQAQEAYAIQVVMSAPIKRLVERIREDPTGSWLDAMKPDQLLKLVRDIAVAFPGIAKFERLARGMPETVEEHRGGGSAEGAEAIREALKDPEVARKLDEVAKSVGDNVVDLDKRRGN